MAGPPGRPGAGEPGGSASPGESTSSLTEAPSASPRPPEADYVGRLEVTPAKGQIGSQATLTGAGFDPGQTLEVVWQTYSGEWVIDNTAAAGEEYQGRAYSEDGAALGAG